MVDASTITARIAVPNAPRAVARGEADPDRLTPRVRAVAFDLFRHDLLVTAAPLNEDQIAAIVDEVFLPLVRPLDG